MNKLFCRKSSFLGEQKVKTAPDHLITWNRWSGDFFCKILAPYIQQYHLELILCIKVSFFWHLKKMIYLTIERRIYKYKYQQQQSDNGKISTSLALTHQKKKKITGCHQLPHLAYHLGASCWPEVGRCPASAPRRAAGTGGGRLAAPPDPGGGQGKSPAS